MGKILMILCIMLFPGIIAAYIHGYLGTTKTKLLILWIDYTLPIDYLICLLRMVESKGNISFAVAFGSLRTFLVWASFALLLAMILPSAVSIFLGKIVRNSGADKNSDTERAKSPKANVKNLSRRPALNIFISIILIGTLTVLPVLIIAGTEEKLLADSEDFVPKVGGASVSDGALMMQGEAGDKLFETYVSLVEVEDFKISFIIDCPAEYAGAVIHVDLANWENDVVYDRAEQEYTVALTAGKNYIQCKLNPGDSAPETAYLRIFTFDAADFAINSLNVMLLKQTGWFYTTAIILFIVLYILAVALLLMLKKEFGFKDVCVSFWHDAKQSIRRFCCYKKVVVSITAIFIFLPAVSTLLGFGSIDTLDENRNRLSFPEGNWTEIFTDDGSYATKLTEAYNDNFGLRDILIRIKNQIHWSLFKDSNGSYLCDDGYLSYVSVTSEEQYSNELLVNEQGGLLDSILSVKNRLAEQGVQLILMIPPQKNTTFPERCNSLPINRPSPNYYEVFDQRIRENELAENYVPLLELLRDAEQYADTYYHTDFHWTTYALSVACKGILEQIGAMEGTTVKYNTYVPLTDDFTMHKVSLLGGQMQGLGLLFPQMENSAAVEINRQCTSVQVEDVPEGDSSHWINQGKAVFDGGVLWIGDSYTDPLSDNKYGYDLGVHDYFTEFYWRHIDDYEDALDNIPDGVKYVVIERIEVHLSDLKTRLDGMFSD